MPINREDGRHWCAPASEQPGEDGSWTCPDCEQVWTFTTEHGYSEWTPSNQDAD